MTLEAEINQAFSRLAKARQQMGAINRLDTSRLESCSVRIQHERYLDLQQEELAAQLEIERLKLVVAARSVDPFFDPETGEEKFLLVARSWAAAKIFALDNGLARWRYAETPALLVGISGYRVVWVPGCEANLHFAGIREVIEPLIPVWLTGEPYAAWKSKEQ
jgi:hypothetical protein